MNWPDISAAAATLFFIMDPLGNTPVFNSILSRSVGYANGGRPVCDCDFIIAEFKPTRSYLGVVRSIGYRLGCNDGNSDSVAVSYEGPRDSWASGFEALDGNAAGAIGDSDVVRWCRIFR